MSTQIHMQLIALCSLCLCSSDCGANELEGGGPGGKVGGSYHSQYDCIFL